MLNRVMITLIATFMCALSGFSMEPMEGNPIFQIDLTLNMAKIYQSTTLAENIQANIESLRKMEIVKKELDKKTNGGGSVYFPKDTTPTEWYCYSIIECIDEEANKPYPHMPTEYYMKGTGKSIDFDSIRKNCCDTANQKVHWILNHPTYFNGVIETDLKEAKQEFLNQYPNFNWKNSQ